MNTPAEILAAFRALLAADPAAAARELAATLGGAALTGQGDQARVAAEVGRELAEAILAVGEHRPSRLALGRLVEATPALGGSNAQRDLFVRILAMHAAEAGDAAACARILAHRRRLKREDRFAWLAAARLEAAQARPGRAA